MKLNLTVIALAMAAAACTPKSGNQPESNNVVEAPNSAVPPTAQPSAVTPVAMNAVANAPTDAAVPPKTSLPEPKGPIDPKSTEAAGQVVQHYGALIEQKKWTESRQYWRDAGTAQAFEKNFQTWKNVHLEIGDLGPAEGAAGSIFTNMPVRFYGDLNKGGPASLKANVILRRVNDVDGSTAAQRRWHIERIETK
jgi:hypothetical protein